MKLFYGKEYTKSKKKSRIIYAALLLIIGIFLSVKIIQLQNSCAGRVFTEINNEEKSALEKHFGIFVSEPAKFTYVNWKYEQRLVVNIEGISDLGNFIEKSYHLSLNADELNSIYSFLKNETSDKIKIEFPNGSEMMSFDEEKRHINCHINDKDNTDAINGQRTEIIITYSHENDSYNLMYYQSLPNDDELQRIITRRPWIF